MRRRDAAIFEVVVDPKATSGMSPRVVFPDDVLEAADAKQLEAHLDRYKDFSGPPADMLRYVEKVRPALRYHCSALGVGTPSWLASDDALVAHPEDEMQRRYGTPDVHVREFRPIRKRRGEAVRETG